jgi:tetratricopeptide (TPR) repeat protein
MLAFFAPIFSVHAGQDDLRLNNLFLDLREASDSERAKATSSKIWQIWSEHPNDELLTKALQSGIQLMNAGRLRNAEQVFTSIIAADNSFAEAWNKRATVYFMMGKYLQSKKDIAQTIMREPRHFGAFSGLGLVEVHFGNYEAALKAYQQAAEIHPYLEGYENIVTELTRLKRGNPT